MPAIRSKRNSLRQVLLPVRVVNKCNRMPPSSLLWADPTGPLQSIVVVALAAAGATPLSSLPSELLLSRAKKTFLVLCPPLEARSYPANSFKCCLCFSCCCRRCVVAVANVVAASVCFSVFAFVFVLNSTYSPTIFVGNDTLQPLPVAVRLQVI